MAAKALTMNASLLRQFAQGPLTIAEFMRACLIENDAYYRNSKAIGEDFLTAPEVSQMFGELIGLWAVDCWRKMGRPTSFFFIELGPGRGTLMKDALRAAKADPDFIRAMELHLVEINPHLRFCQEHALSDFKPRLHDDIFSLPEGPFILIANEFFDCLPLHQFEHQADGWIEWGIEKEKLGNKLFFVKMAPGPQFALIEQQHKKFVEISPASLSILRHFAENSVAWPGISLIIDYGYIDEDNGNTLQSMKGHKKISPLDRPGESDLTAHVDFKRLAKIAQTAGAKCFGPTTQAQFLSQLGIEYRARQLKEEAASLYRLTSPLEMGTLFKVLAIGSPQLDQIAGFDA